MNQTKQKPSAGRTVQRVVLAVLALAVIVSVIVFVVTRKTPPAKASPIQARLELAAGEVTADLGDGPVRAVSGTPLLEGAKLSTDKGARALIRLPDGSRLFLRSDSTIALATDSVVLEAGEYFVDAPPTDRKPLSHALGDTVVTAAEAGLSIRRNGGDATVYVARGMATVTGKGGRVEVKAGEQATVKGGDKPSVAPLAFWDDWTGGMADFASGSRIPGAGMGSIYGVDVGAASGSPARRLEIGKQAVRAVVREGLSETEVDQTFFNPGERAVEGWYWFTVPETASVTGFALETDGVLVEGEFIEKKEAAAQYGAAKASGHSPAILEWIDSRTYRARIYPVPAGGTRRVVLRYIELRPSVDEKISYVYPMGAGDPVRIGEFSLSVDLGDAGTKMKLATLADARVEDGGKRVTMRRSGYTPRADFQLEARLSTERPPFTVARFSPGGESADYLMARFTPDVDWKSVKQQRADVVVVVDTSAAGDESSRQLKTQAAEAILRGLSDDDRFALIALDVRPAVLHPKEGLSPAADKEIAKALEALADHSTGGATDLASLFDVALGRLHGTEQPAVVYVGDGIATSGEMSGEQLVERLRRALGTSRARLFTVAVGTDANHALLGELSRAGGGVNLRVDEAEQTTARALELAAAIKTPTITDLQIDLGAGLDEPFVSASGKVSRGSEVVVLARTHHDIPRTVKVRGRIGGEAFEREYETKKESGVLASFVPRLWAAEYVRRLLGAAQGPEAERGRIVALGVEYGLMTPFTSVLALESESAYSRMGIQRRKSNLRGVQLTALDPTTERRLAARLSAVPAAAMPLGCSKLERLADDEAPASAPMTRAKGEEGSMGAQSPLSGGYAQKAEPEAQNEAPPMALPTALPPGDPLAEAKPAEEPVPGADLPRAAAAPPAPAKAARAYARPASPSGLGLSGIGRGGGGKGDGIGLGRAKLGPTPLEDRDKENDDATRDQREEKKRQVAQVLYQPTAAVEPVLKTCSDAAARPLAQRVLLWLKRLKTADNANELVQRYDGAREACELTDWRAERTFLELMQRSIDSEGTATAVLRHFASRPEVQKHLAKLILRRAVDERLVAAVERTLFGSAVDWAKVDLELTELADVDKRITRVREAIAKAPEDPNGGMRLVKLLVEAGKKDEAVSLGRRLRDQGLLTPNIARQLGDVLARAGHAEEAVRTYSEIVEFDPEGIASRRLLGDIYLGHGWYEPAYRQYRTITEMNDDDALGWLRLAAAAAGTGRVDEALRLERRVASGQGTPGPSDPRRWARLSSAARLARLIAEPPKPAAGQPAADPARRAASLKRELKELSLFSGPGQLVVLTWEDLGSDVVLVSRVDGTDTGLGEATDAARAGLSAILLTTSDADRASFAARLRSERRDVPVAVVRHDVIWDGKDFKVAVKKKQLAAKETELGL